MWEGVCGGCGFGLLSLLFSYWNGKSVWIDGNSAHEQGFPSSVLSDDHLTWCRKNAVCTFHFSEEIAIPGLSCCVKRAYVGSMTDVGGKYVHHCGTKCCTFKHTLGVGVHVQI